MLKLFSVVGIALIVFPCYYGHAKDLSVEGDKYFENRQWDKAIDEYKELLSKNKNQPEIYFKLGNTYSKKGDLDKAIEALKKALSQGLNIAKIHYYLGNVYHKMDKMDKAIVEYKQAIEINSKLIAPHYNLGMIYLDKKKTDLAIKEFTKVIFLDHDYANAYLNRAKAYELKGDRANAQNDYNSSRHAPGAC